MLWSLRPGTPLLVFNTAAYIAASFADNKNGNIYILTEIRTQWLDMVGYSGPFPCFCYLFKTTDRLIFISKSSQSTDRHSTQMAWLSLALRAFGFIRDFSWAMGRACNGICPGNWDVHQQNRQWFSWQVGMLTVLLLWQYTWRKLLKEEGCVLVHSLLT